MSEGARRAIEAIPASQRWGALCFYGEWFGGGPSNQHTLTDVQGDEGVLVLTFNQGETLRVENPTDITVTDEGLRIARASQVRWEWFYYGRPKTPANRYVIEYRVDSDGAIRGHRHWRLVHAAPRDESVRRCRRLPQARPPLTPLRGHSGTLAQPSVLSPRL
jgi:hypothetical protein